MREKGRAIVLYRSPAVLSNDKAIAFIKEILEEVFGEYVEFENCFMADIPYGRKLDTAYLLYENGITHVNLVPYDRKKIRGSMIH